MTRVLIVTHDVVGVRMAGPAIRCVELARQLSEACEVTVTSLMPLDGAIEAPFKVVSFEDDPRRLRALAEDSDVLVLQGLMPRRFPFLLELGKYLVMDLYDPFLFESYPHLLSLPHEGKSDFLEFWDTMNEQMEVADFSICASERQRDMWIGRYCALGRLTPVQFDADPSFRHLIDLVPFGVSDEPPRHERPVLKGVVPGIEENDKVILWGGGIWNWFDPLTLIRAVGQIAERRQDVKLYFLGVKHPNPEIPEMAMAAQAVQLAEELGLKERYVFFNHDWVPYTDRQNYLAEADIGVSSHFDSVETRFSFRTRVLDYLWAGLPVVSTEGDAMAELVASRGLGMVTRYGSVDDWVVALTRVLDDASFQQSARANVRAVADEYRWSQVAAPLRHYCEAPYRSARSYWSVSLTYNRGTALSRARKLVGKTLKVLENDGIGGVLDKGVRFVGRRMSLRPRVQ